MKKIVIAHFLVLTLSAYTQPLILEPSISPNGEVIAFTYQGDIWKVSVDGGRADRLTIHEADESGPVWNADGSKIGFSSDRFGNDDVFVMNSGGGSPQRITFHSTADNLYSFTADDNVLFTTSRLYKQVERESEIFSSSLDGATPSRYMDALGFDPVNSPDGSKVAFVRGTCRVAREAYRGSANRDIWIWNIEENSYSKLTSFDGNEFSPRWINNNQIAFISSKSGKYNVHQIDLDGTEKQLTNEVDFGVNTFSVSGSMVVYQYGDQVALLNIETGDKSVVSIDVSTDYRFDPVVSKSTSNNVSEFAVSPNGKFSAYVVRGELFVTRNDKEDSRSVRITKNSARERDVTWLNDQTILFVSDLHGQNDLFLATSADATESEIFFSLKHKITRVTNSPEEEFNPVVSPNGKMIALRQDRGKLLTANLSTSGELTSIRTLLDGWDTPGGVSWSPDSKWLAYSLSDLNFNEEIFIHAADNSKEPINVSMHPKTDRNPVWSKDGSKLGFVSYRNNGDGDVWFAWLKKEEWEKSKEEWKREGFLDDEDETEAPFRIDFEDLYQRLTQVTSFAGNETEFVFDNDGECVYYTLGSAGRQDYKVERNLYKIKWDGTDREELVGGDRQPSQLAIDQEGEYVFLNSKGGKIIRIKTKDDKEESLSVKSMMTVDYVKEREQIFEEGWRALKAGFYDPNFHGQNWNQLKEKYKPLCMKASTKEDFKYYFNLMLGQLNASHMGMYRGENPKETQSEKTGLIGVEGENEENGFRITSILPNSPADNEKSNLMIDDIILSIDQEIITPTTNIYSLLTNKIDDPVLFEIMRQGSKKEIVIWPVSSLGDERYDDWVETRRELTEELSQGRLGYLHIRGMNWTSFERFERELMAAGYGKEGIVIDVRYNGGGWTTDYLMTVLNVRQHAYTIPRGAAENLETDHLKFKNTYPFGERLPLASWTKPSITMCNQNSYSNAEIFSHAYKTLGLGTLVGTPTFGAVISTGGWSLVDGSFVRMPFRAWYVKETEENMEWVPATPDILIDNPPAYKARGTDDQLKKAIDTLLEQLE